jgi:hypothetical protein
VIEHGELRMHASEREWGAHAACVSCRAARPTRRDHETAGRRDNGTTRLRDSGPKTERGGFFNYFNFLNFLNRG